MKQILVAIVIALIVSLVVSIVFGALAAINNPKELRK